jgi:hypothetical protein
LQMAGASMNPAPSRSVAFVMTLAVILASLGSSTGQPSQRPCVARNAAGPDAGHLQAACDSVATRFRKLFGVAPPPGEVSAIGSLPWTFTWSSSRWTVGWPRRRVWQDVAAGIDTGMMSQVDMIQAHEIGHVMMFAFFNATVTVGEYGTPLPDWFDEAVAIWAEPESSTYERLHRARAIADSSPRIDVIASMRHPMPQSDSVLFVATAVRGPCRGVCRTERPNESRRIRLQVDRRGRTSVDTSYGEPPVESLYAREFYPLSYALLRFVAEAGGQSAIDSMVARLRAGYSAAELLVGLPGLPRERDALQARWLDWLRRGR